MRAIALPFSPCLQASQQLPQQAALPDGILAAPLTAASSRWCHWLPRSGKLFRTDFRFAPSPRRASLAGPPIHGGHGRPRSVRKSSRLRWECLSMDCICSDRRKSFDPSAPIAYATFVSPPDEAAAWPGVPFQQITARANPCSRHLWGTLARSVTSI